MLIRDRLGTFVAVVLGTAILAASLILWTSGRPRVPDRFAGLSVVVQSPAAANPADSFAEPVPWSADAAQRLADRLRALPGVTAVVQDRPFYAQPVRSGRPAPSLTTGYGWASTTDRLTAGRPPEGDRDVVVDAALGVPVGQSITLLTAGGPASWLVTGHVDAPSVFVSDRVAAQFSPGVRAIGLGGAPDVEAVRKVVAGAGSVLTGSDRGALEPRSHARTRWIGMQVLTATTALAGFACVFLVASTNALSVNQRRREIGLLRAVGATPRQIRSALYGSALRVGAAAGAVGVILGALAAVPLARVLVDSGFQPVGYGLRWEPWAPAVALLVGPVVSLLGAAASARRASRIGPLEALQVAEVESRPMSRSRWILGLAAGVVGAAASVYTTTAAEIADMARYALLGAMALVIAATVLAPAVVPLLVRVLLRPATGVIGVLVRESALAGVRRTASTAAPVLLAVAFAVFVAGTAQTSASAFAARRAAAVEAGSVLVPDGTPGLSDAAASDMPLPTTVYVAEEAVPTVGVSTGGTGTALVSSAAADRFGDMVTVTYADGVRETLRITGVAPAGTTPADLVIDRAAVRAHDPSALSPAAFLPDGVPVIAAPGAEVVDVATYARRAGAEEDRTVWMFTLLLLGVSAGAGALAVANTLLMATRHRRRDYQVLGLAGATPGQVMLTVALESTVVVAIGSVLGGSVALLALLGSAKSLGAQVGHTVHVVMPWSVASAVVAGCLALAIAASALPARRLRAGR